MDLEFDGFDRDAFLRDSWQRRPLLIRQAWKNWRNPLDPDELAGLACEAGVESRLVIGDTADRELEHGPFAERRFASLAARPWTLLVQAVDHHVPAVAALMAPFRFVPNWRIDDVMVSYASDGGGVGPHFDHYDVFLVQGLGRRRWRIGGRCDARSPLVAHPDLRLLADFAAVTEWLLEPGDVLYLPPGIAHDGIAVGDDCMTYSIGFRAPSRGELIELWSDAVLAGLDDDDRYADPGLPVQGNPGEITDAALAQLHAMVASTLDDRAAFARWFGKHASTPRNPEIDWSPDHVPSADALQAALAAGAALARNPASRFAFVAQADGSVFLFVDGDCHEGSSPIAAFARLACGSDRFALAPALAADPGVVELVVRLCARGSLALADD